MFEQTLLNEPEKARKPYSMLVSLLLQVGVVAVLCLTPIVFTQVLPAWQLRSVLAAPPKPPSAVKVVAVSEHSTSIGQHPVFRILDFRPTVKAATARNSVGETPAPSLGVGDIVGDPNGVPDSTFGAALPPPVPASVTPVKPKPLNHLPIRVGGTVSNANLIHMVQPVYPPMAKTSRTEGMVEFTATISKAGTIENLQLVRGNPLLVKAAEEAVLQWRYRPTLLNGEPVEVITDILVNFRLSQ